MAAMPVIPERAALVEVLLAEMAATAATAATAGRLMEATRLVALGDRALTAARRPEAMAATEGGAGMGGGGGKGGGAPPTAGRGGMPGVVETAGRGGTLAGGPPRPRAPARPH